jgi:putative DNA primase/helicase
VSVRSSSSASTKRPRRRPERNPRPWHRFAKLPRDVHDTRLAELARRLDENIATIRDEFDEYCALEIGSEDRSIEWYVEPWPEPFSTAAVLHDLINKIDKHVIVKPHEALAAALWTMMAWVHNQIAHHSPYLVATSPEDSAGKTTLIVETVGRLAPKAYNAGEPTAAIVRFIDREKPSLFVDDADVLFQRKRDLAHMFNVAWTRGVPRHVQGSTVWYDPFCPKAVTLIGTNLPRALYGRCIMIKMWPLKADEHVEEITGDDDEFATLRRKLARWGADNVDALALAKPLFPAGLTQKKTKPNWKLLLAIAELAGGDWPKRARDAAERLSRANRKPSLGVQLLVEMHKLFATRTEITSVELVEILTSDPTSPWCEYRGARGLAGKITQRQIADLLEPYEIHPVVIHPTKRKNLRRHGYKKVQFEDAFARFLPRDPNIRTSTTKRKKTLCR